MLSLFLPSFLRSSSVCAAANAQTKSDRVPASAMVFMDSLGTMRAAMLHYRQVAVNPPAAHSESEGRSDRRTAEAKILQELVVALVVGQGAIREHRVAPAECIRDTHEGLPGDPRGAGSGVHVVGDGPAPPSQTDQPTHAHDRVPQVCALRD